MFTILFFLICLLFLLVLCWAVYCFKNFTYIKEKNVELQNSIALLQGQQVSTESDLSNLIRSIAEEDEKRAAAQVAHSHFYTDEEKAAAKEFVKENLGKMMQKDMAAHLGIPASTINGWVREMRKEEATAAAEVNTESTEE